MIHRQKNISVRIRNNVDNILSDEQSKKNGNKNYFIILVLLKKEYHAFTTRFKQKKNIMQLFQKCS